MRSSGVVARDGERRARDVDADFVVAVGKLAHRERVVDLGGGCVVDRECARIAARQLAARAATCPTARTARPRGKASATKAPEVIVVRGRNRAARREKLHRIRLARFARRAERLPLERVLVRLVEQHRKTRAQRVGQAVLRKLAHPGRDLLALARLALDRGKGSLQRIGRRLAIAPLALLVEMHRRGVQQHRHRGGLRGRRAARRSTRARDRRIRTRRPRSPPTGSWGRGRPRACALRRAARKARATRSEAGRCPP